MTVSCCSIGDFIQLGSDLKLEDPVHNMFVFGLSFFYYRLEMLDHSYTFRTYEYQ